MNGLFFTLHEYRAYIKTSLSCLDGSLWFGRYFVPYNFPLKQYLNVKGKIEELLRECEEKC